MDEFQSGRSDDHRGFFKLGIEHSRKKTIMTNGITQESVWVSSKTLFMIGMRFLVFVGKDI